MAGEKSRTRGGDLLERCPDSHAEIAAKVGVDKSLVTRWISGERSPSEDDRLQLKEFYGIPAIAWRQLASIAAKPPSAPRLPSPPPVPSFDSDDDDAEDDDAHEPPEEVDIAGEGNTEMLRRFIRQGMRDLQLDKGLSGLKRSEALKKLVEAQCALDRSTGENALTMNKIVAHPDFQRVVRMITEAIAPYPEALAAVAKALETVRS